MARFGEIGIWKAWLWLVVATIGLHALLPVGSPVARGSGSPFSVSTVEVSTAPSRDAGLAAEAESERRLPDDAGMDAAPMPAQAAAPPAAPPPIDVYRLPAVKYGPQGQRAALPPARAPPAADGRDAPTAGARGL